MAGAVEYLDLIDPLTDPRKHGADPAQAFDVVIPSLPGFGFSSPARNAGWGTQRTARAWAELMARLGYDRYGAVGNDASFASISRSKTCLVNSFHWASVRFSPAIARLATTSAGNGLAVSLDWGFSTAAILPGQPPR
jgi:hypothetical protein